jgi:antitoxin ChpS
MSKSAGKAPRPPTGKTASALHFTERNQQSGQSRAVSAVTGPKRSAGFLATTRLKKSGGSLVMTVPAPARKLLHLTEGQEMAVSVEGSKVIVEPASAGKVMQTRQPKYTLDELVAGMNPDTPLTNEERAWTDASPAGREIW